MAYPKTYMCRFSSLFKHFFPVQIDIFHFLSGGVKQIAKNFTFYWFWLVKMHWNGLSGADLGLEACWIQWHRFWVSTISISWKIKISGKNFIFCWFWLEKNASKWLEWHIFRVQGMPNPMALVSHLYDRWFLKIEILGDK